MSGNTTRFASHRTSYQRTALSGNIRLTQCRSFRLHPYPWISYPFFIGRDYCSIRRCRATSASHRTRVGEIVCSGSRVTPKFRTNASERDRGPCCRERWDIGPFWVSDTPVWRGYSLGPEKLSVRWIECHDRYCLIFMF